MRIDFEISLTYLFILFPFRFLNTQIIIIIVICLLRKKLSGLAALFEEASNCMLDMPSLLLPSILASIVLALFLTFWVAVVVCLATANYPGAKPLVPQTPGNLPESSGIDHPPLRYRGNNDSDYKSFNRIEYLDAHLLQNLLWVYVIGLIWTVEFIFGE